MDTPLDVESHAQRGPTAVVRLGLLAVGLFMGLLIVQGVQRHRIDLVLVSVVCLAAAALGLWMSFRLRGA